MTPRAIPLGLGAVAAAIFAGACGSSQPAAPQAPNVARPANAAPNLARPASPSPPARPAAAVAPTTTTARSPLTGAAGGGARTAATEQGVVRPFAASSPWNTPVDQLSAAANSDRLIRLAQTRVETSYVTGRAPRVRLRRINAGLFINVRRWTVPIVQTTSGVPTRVVCRQKIVYCGDGAKVDSLSIPPNESPRPEFDGWLTVEDPRAGVAYDLWRARRSADGGIISYQFMRKWELAGPGYQKPGSVSARGSGLPLFAGVILPQEIRAGVINHALSISLPGPARRNYVQPASATDGSGRLDSLPEGARIRLKPGVPLGRLPGFTSRKAARAIHTALRRYGAIVVDRSRVPTLYAQLNFNWLAPLRDPSGKLLDGAGHPLPRSLRGIPGQQTPLLRGNEVQSLRVSDFEVVAVPGAQQFPRTAGPNVLQGAK